MDVITIGESMAVFTPYSSSLMRYAHLYSSKFGGAESNVAIGLSRLGHNVAWISKVGNDEFGKSMLAFIRGEGVNVSQVLLSTEAATGLYFKEVRSSNDVRVQYYRKGSAASTLRPSDLNPEFIQKAKYLHVTGITPALSKTCYETILYAIRVAKESGVTVIFDPNLRRKLWSEEDARRTLIEIASLSDIILPGIDEGEFMFHENSVEKLGELFLNLGPSIVILKVGAKGAYYFTKEEKRLVTGFQVDKVIDPVGAGDGFAAGVISGLLDQLSLEEAVKRGTALGAMATQVEGDFEGLPDREEMLRFMNESHSEDVVR